MSTSSSEVLPWKKPLSGIPVFQSSHLVARCRAFMSGVLAGLYANVDFYSGMTMILSMA